MFKATSNTNETTNETIYELIIQINAHPGCAVVMESFSTIRLDVQYGYGGRHYPSVWIAGLNEFPDLAIFSDGAIVGNGPWREGLLPLLEEINARLVQWDEDRRREAEAAFNEMSAQTMGLRL